MVNRGMLILGSILIGLGALFFIGSVLHIDIGALCFPIALILAGVWLAFRPNLSGRGGPANVVLIGDHKRRGDWQVDDAEFWVGVGDIDLDMGQAFIPQGETVLHCYGFVNEMTLRLPPDVGYAITASAFVANAKVMGRKTETILSPLQLESPDFASAARRIRVEAVGFVVEIKIK
jgi:hypothetical protein